ncbi:MAG TPA: DUF5996 family protein [Solirubrobacteraceae bacterium]
MSDWPSLRVADWTETRDALHLFTQIVGKVKLVKTPLVNHWWNVTLYVGTRGLTTGPIPDQGRIFALEFDFVSGALRVELQGGERREVSLRSMSVAELYTETMRALAELGIRADIYPVPVELEQAIPFPQDTRRRYYQPDAARLFWRQLVQAHRVMSEFRAGFVGKASPVHFFWGSFDLAATRFSGRPAPRHPGGVPNCPDWVMVESYSRELASCGFWPGGGEEGAFYAYAYPEPDGFAAAVIRPPEEAYYSTALGQFLLPYEAVRESPDPDATLLEFLHDTYDSAAQHGNWDPTLAIAPRRPD